MNYILAATYLILIGLIVLLMVLLVFRNDREMENIEASDAILGPEEAEKHAIEIARSHVVKKNTGWPRRLVPRLLRNFRFIREVYSSLAGDVDRAFPTSPAAEWLLDNFYIIEEQVNDIRQNLSRRTYSRLPVLKSGYLRGYPRVYAISLELVSHSDGRIDEKNIISFIKSYQSQVLLSIGELWAMAAMLRIALIANLRYISSNMLETQGQWHRAEIVAELLEQAADKSGDELASTIRTYLKAAEDMNPSFLEHLVQKLRRQGRKTSGVIRYLESVLAENNTSLETVAALEHQVQAARQVSMGNAITSLKLVSTIDWNDIFESLSQVERILGEDPSGVYKLMDLESHDYYRHRVEILARKYNVSEVMIARKAVECAQTGIISGGGDVPSGHIGYYLARNGAKQFESRTGYKPAGLSHITDKILNNPTVTYLGAIAFITVILLAFFCGYASEYSTGVSTAGILLTALAVLIPASDMAVAVINFAVCHFTSPSMLPKLKLSEGIPPDSATMVIIPTLLPNEKRVGELLEQLEIHYLANKEENLYFALVGDFKDSNEAEQPEDDAIVKRAAEGVKRLNERYAKDGRDIFFYFHRRRKLNEAHNKWMGWERKRGAIIEINDLLLGSGDTDYYVTSAGPEKLPRLKFVITLDADTSLPIGTAKKLIGTLSHPLNKPAADRSRGVVTEGYGLLQPRIDINITSANNSLFSRIFAGQGGLDPYSSAISDVYQDMFSEGIFTGKGIYDLEVFQNTLKGLIPDNKVLSHDLLEGLFVRTGLVTDIELVDGYPSRYNAYAMRLHRWVRGDWQLLPWLLPRIRDRHGDTKPNPLSPISKWKIIDNMRRSLVAPSVFILILAGFSLLPGNPAVWLALAAATIGFPVLILLLKTAVTGGYSTAVRIRNFKVICGLKGVLYQCLLQFTFLPYQAYLMADAIIRTLFRVIVTRRNLLEWVTAADMEASLKNDASAFWRRMWISLPASVLILFLGGFMPGIRMASGVLLAAVWAAGPQVAYKISKKYISRIERFSKEDIDELRRLSRKTWRYFEDMVTPEDNFLPPDNFQEMPPNGVAHRTSPTNIGLLLAAMVCARDLGFMGLSELAEKLDNTISTIEKMEKWEGHLYNWYETTNLSILRPAYVSTVDSGNYIGYLMVVEHALSGFMKSPLVTADMAYGLKDTINLLNEDVRDAGIIIDTTPIDEFLTQEIGIKTWRTLLGRLLSAVRDHEIQETIKKLPWGKKLAGMTASYKSELSSLIPLADMAVDENRMAGTKIGRHLLDSLKNPSLQGLIALYESALSEAGEEGSQGADASGGENLLLVKQLEKKTREALTNAKKLMEQYNALLLRIKTIIGDIKFAPLYDKKRQLFSIGFNVEEGRLTKSYYDLFVSEARQTSYIAIARGEIDKKHWFRLGRKLIMADEYRGLVSWTGTMFEYLMPLLIMRNYENTLLDETYSFAVKTQKAYGRKRNIPWGTSESAFYAFDRNLNYQYKAFGVPGLGLKRGLGHDMVVAPYATVLALSVDPRSALANIRRLADEGMDGAYGLYEAVDYTPSRLRAGKKSNIVRNFMVHHQGMSLLALNNFLNDNIMQHRFHSNPVIKSAELLLQEKVPSRYIVAKEHRERYTPVKKISREEGEVIRRFGIPDSELPNVHLLSNGSYCVMVTAGGSGYSRLNEMAVTRWRENLRGPGGGSYIFIQNINSNTDWCATFEPYNETPEKYRVTFGPDKAEYMRKDGNIETHTELIVSTEDNAEIRRVSLINRGQNARVLEVTSYFEVVLAHPDADIAHPAFSNLFVTTEFVREYECLLASRRPRSAKDKGVWAAHGVIVEGETVGDIQFETDRFKFIGRNRDLSRPLAMEPDHPLSNSEGPVLDPVMCLRRRVRVEPGQTVRLSFVTGVAKSRKHALEMTEKYREAKAVERAFELAWNRSQIESRYLDFKSSEVELYLRMAPHILYAGPLRQKWATRISANIKAQPGLWPFGISGDLPVLLLLVESKDETDLIQTLLKAHEYWHMKGLTIDLVILVNEEKGYFQPVMEAAKDAVSSSHAREMLGRKGGVFIINGGQITEEDKNLLYAAARIVLNGSEGPVLEQLQFRRERPDTGRLEASTAGQSATTCNSTEDNAVNCFDTGSLMFFNGIGGFLKNGREYGIIMKEGSNTPAPWINVISNPGFGFLFSESGGGYTWAENSRENKLTPWSNDPVTDPPSEVIYLRDEKSGSFTSVTARFDMERTCRIVRHGMGWSSVESKSYGIEHETVLFAALEKPVKIYLLKIKNTNSEVSEISLTYYMRPVLGVSDNISAQYINTWNDSGSGAVMLSNPYNSDFPGRIAFISVSEPKRTTTCDRTEFIGINGSVDNPEAMKSSQLSGMAGGGLDPCGAIQVKLHLSPGEEKGIVFLLGQEKDAAAASKLAKEFADPLTAGRELESVKSFWERKLGILQVSTPDSSMDVLLNGWLPYQVTACRMWARSAFYQSGGAFGFRDQLQDSMALVFAWPELVKNQLLLHASHQFVEGDVQHWWHPGAGKGIRTRYSDDLLWLPYVTADYIRNTGDHEILDEVTGFIEDDLLPPDEDERYSVPRQSQESATLYEHCIRAIDASLKTGEHGIPLMGSGDWNDGMNTVGNGGKGESVWLGWFLYSIMSGFIPICKNKNDNERAERYEMILEELKRALEQNAWDGSWYRRAYFDDGTPLGSVQNPECRIDSIAQSWSVISGAGKPARSSEAMNALEKHLVDRQTGIIKLLTPPFNSGDLEPGYIKGYVPGVRENGGQYTHAAVWTILAFARMGKGDTALELFHMINPVNHSRTPIEMSAYKVEPYVMAADVYAVPPNVGRGGWTWYTGAAGWMYRVGMESILGIKKYSDSIVFEPCIPGGWLEYSVSYRYMDTDYRIIVKNPGRVSGGVKSVSVDGSLQQGSQLKLVNDKAVHSVEVLLG